MTLSFSLSRYLLTLLWHWSLPFTLGAVCSAFIALYGIQSSLELVDQSLDGAIQRVVATCTTDAPETVEISGAKRSLFPPARGPTSPTGALATHPPPTL